MLLHWGLVGWYLAREVLNALPFRNRNVRVDKPGVTVVFGSGPCLKQLARKKDLARVSCCVQEVDRSRTSRQPTRHWLLQTVSWSRCYQKKDRKSIEYTNIQWEEACGSLWVSEKCVASHRITCSILGHPHHVPIWNNDVCCTMACKWFIRVKTKLRSQMHVFFFGWMQLWRELRVELVCMHLFCLGKLNSAHASKMGCL